MALTPQLLKTVFPQGHIRFAMFTEHVNRYRRFLNLKVTCRDCSLSLIVEIAKVGPDPSSGRPEGISHCQPDERV